ncbi:SitI3 family protein [Lentzea sp. JNUCC 0626]|uniref:SitI3 family protein n=1 Tax=Lentzea sp. JNUCC 0626 TaxID=3367513 RepID=UPI003749EB6A
MALSYSLDIATSLSADQVARRLPVLPGDPEVTLGQLLQGVAVAEGTWLRVGATEPSPWSVVESDLGFAPTVWVVFRLDKETDTARQLDDVVRRTIAVLDEVPGDAVLHFDYEVVWLLRRGGELSLNDRDDIWTPQRLAAVGSRPHRRGTPSFA